MPTSLRHRCVALATALSASTLAADDITSWFEPNAGWIRAESVAASPGETRLEAAPSAHGDILYNGAEWSESGFLVARSVTEDCIVSFDYMLPEGATAGVYLHGRYELRLSDSHGEQSLDFADLGGINERWDPERAGEPGYEGAPPLANAAKPPGTWQSVEIWFRAPRFNEAGFKTDPATFLKVEIDGEVVQRNAFVSGYTRGALYPWDQTDGAVAIRGDRGPIALRDFAIKRADFGALKIEESGGASNMDELIDLVSVGRDAFHQTGCIECHATKQGDESMKTGPNLWGLFQREPRQRLVAEPGSDAAVAVLANRSYHTRSIRQPAVELAISESGPKAGETYLPVMPPMTAEIIDDTKVDAIYQYLLTLNERDQRGPAVAFAESTGPEHYDPLEDPNELLVADRTRIQRGSMRGVSGRSIHVGLPNRINYTFDPQNLAYAKLWQGGFLNAAGEWEGRGGNGFAPGFDNREIPLGEIDYLVAPLDASGQPVDFSFKEADFRDWDTIAASLHSEQDHLARLEEIDAGFDGYELDSTNPEASPTFNYRLGDNRVSIHLQIDSDGSTAIRVTGDRASDQAFRINTAVFAEARAEAGRLDANGVWTVPSGTEPATLRAQAQIARNAWSPPASEFEFLRQPLEIRPSEGSLPPGYRIEEFVTPKDNYGRAQLFEALGMDRAPDGSIVVAARTAGVWRIVDGEWRRFAEGLFDPLGVVVEDRRGLQVVASQKPELTQIVDTNGDGLADRYDTLADQHSYHSNYHSYMHGPVRDEAGNYYFNLNLLHTDEAIYKADGLYMGSSGGFSGWTIKLTPEGEFIPWANGLRSPAGLSFGPDSRLWYSENQGEFVGTSKLFVLEEGKFYGHPSGLVDLPGMTPDSPEIDWENVADGRERAVVLFPHNIVANAPGHPAWDSTAGAFGPFAGQMFIGDQTRSNLLRVFTEVVDGVEQGCVVPFAKGLQSGVMRPLFLPDGSLMLGQTGRGWQADGGHVASLQRVVWDGETVPADILRVHALEQGFEVVLTQPLAESVTAELLGGAATAKSWRYRDAPDYGSPELDTIDEQLTDFAIGRDRLSFRFNYAARQEQSVPNQTARVFHIAIKGADALFDAQAPQQLDAFYTRY